MCTRFYVDIHITSKETQLGGRAGLTVITGLSFSEGAPLIYCMALSTLTISFSVSVNDVTTPDRRFVTDRAYDIARPTKPVWKNYYFTKVLSIT